MSRLISKSTEDDIIKILSKSSHPVDKTVDSAKMKKMTSQSETIMKMVPKATNTIKRGSDLSTRQGRGLQVDAAPGYGYGLQVNGRGLQVGGRGLQVDTFSGRGIIDPRKGNDLYSNNYV